MILEIMDEIVKEKPLSCEFETDARYVWPERWDRLRKRVDGFNIVGHIIPVTRYELAWAIDAAIGVMGEGRAAQHMIDWLQSKGIPIKVWDEADSATLTGMDESAKAMKEKLESILSKDDPDEASPEDRRTGREIAGIAAMILQESGGEK
jgi:hypothetical protein